MPRFGTNLFDLFNKRNCYFSPESVYSLGIQLVTIFEKLHDSGYVYNDLKLDNLLLDFSANM